MILYCQNQLFQDRGLFAVDRCMYAFRKYLWLAVVVAKSTIIKFINTATSNDGSEAVLAFKLTSHIYGLPLNIEIECAHRRLGLDPIYIMSNFLEASAPRLFPKLADLFEFNM
jgi:hypothetical protein